MTTLPPPPIQGVPDSLFCRHCRNMRTRIREILFCRRCDAGDNGVTPTWAVQR